MTMRIRRALARRASGDAGFTLIEVIVAMVITVMVMTALVYGVVGTLKTVEQAKQRQAATALATQELERLRALPYDTVTLAAASSSLKTPNPYAATVSGVSTFTPPAGLLTTGSESLVVNTVSGQWADVSVDQVTYRVYDYVTTPALTGGNQTYNLTAVVHWSSSVWPGGRTSLERSTTFSPAGCLSTANSPFAAPCQAYVTARAGEALSGVTISDINDSTQPILGTDTDQLLLNFSTASATFQVEQTATRGANAVTTSAQSKGGASPATSGGVTAKAVVDSDPSSTPNQSVSVVTPAQSSSSVSITGSGGTLAVTPSTSDSGGASAAIAADGSTCVGSTGTALTTGPSGQLRPCASSNLRASGSPATVQYISPLLSANLTLASFSAQVQPSRAVAAVLGTSNTGACDGSGTPVDCVHASTTRSLGTATFAAGGFVSAPSGFTGGLWSVSNLAESARAEEGVGSKAPIFTRTGTLKVWNGTGYTSVDLSGYAGVAGGLVPPTQTWTIPTTSVQYSPAITLVYHDSTVTVQRPAISRTPTARTGNPATDCKAAACVTTIDGSASVVASVQVDVLVNGSLLTSFAVVTDLGGLTANVSYKAAAA